MCGIKISFIAQKMVKKLIAQMYNIYQQPVRLNNVMFDFKIEANESLKIL